MPMTNHNPPHDWQHRGKQHNTHPPLLLSHKNQGPCRHSRCGNQPWMTDDADDVRPPPATTAHPNNDDNDNGNATSPIQPMNDDDLAHQRTCHIVQSVTTHVVTEVQVSNISYLPISVVHMRSRAHQQQTPPATIVWRPQPVHTPTMTTTWQYHITWHPRRMTSHHHFLTITT